MALEEAFQTAIDETAYNEAQTISDIERLLVRAALSGAISPLSGKSMDLPTWARSAFARLIRRISYPTWLIPLAKALAWARITGLEHLSGVDGPVLFAANHQSHMDTLAIFAALPARWRYRLAPAMRKEFFDAHFHPGQHGILMRFVNSLAYYLAALFFAGFPLPQEEAGARQTLRYIGDLVSEGYSILIYPEGARTTAGEIATFRQGVGMIASRLQVPIIPVRLEGLDRVLHTGWWIPRPGRVRITFGEMVRPNEREDYAALTARVEEAVRNL